jgi:hypothetical protein
VGVATRSDRNAEAAKDRRAVSNRAEVGDGRKRVANNLSRAGTISNKTASKADRAGNAPIWIVTNRSRAGKIRNKVANSPSHGARAVGGEVDAVAVEAVINGTIVAASGVKAIVAVAVAANRVASKVCHPNVNGRANRNVSLT